MWLSIPHKLFTPQQLSAMWALATACIVISLAVALATKDEE